VQLGTAFAVTEECDASAVFKRILAKAKPQDLVEFVSVAGLPARAVLTPWLDKYLRILPVLQERAHPKAKCNMSFDCLQHCGLRDGDSNIGQFCIDQQLSHALDGDMKRGLFFRGAGTLPFGEQIKKVSDLIKFLLTPELTNHHLQSA
jgi:nitronate monooxygenase